MVLINHIADLAVFGAIGPVPLIVAVAASYMLGLGGAITYAGVRDRISEERQTPHTH